MAPENRDTQVRLRAAADKAHWYRVPRKLRYKVSPQVAQAERVCSAASGARISSQDAEAARAWMTLRDG